MHADTIQNIIRLPLTSSFGRLTPDMRPQPFQDEVGRYLENDIRNKEDSQGDVEVVALELEILWQPIDGSISNIDSGHASRSCQ